MTTQALRRSGRIPKKIVIVLQGTDTMGRFFSEETHTVVLSRHGAGIISVNKPVTDESLSISIPGTTKQAAVRLVGRMGGNSSNFIYGVAFLDPTLDFWELDFPAAFHTFDLENSGDRVTLECCLCQSVQQMSDSEIEADVYAINQNILMYCVACGTTSIWKRARSNSPRNPPSSSVKLPARHPHPPAFVSRLTTAPVGAIPAKSGSVKPVPQQAFAQTVAELAVVAKTVVALTDVQPIPRAKTFSAVVETAISIASKFVPPPEISIVTEVHLAGSPSSASAQPAVSSDSNSAHVNATEECSTGSVAVQTASPASDVSLTPDASSRSAETIPLPPLKLSQLLTLPPPPAPRPPNRRKDVRTGVTFTACIRNTAGREELVECDNISRSGFSFRSRSCYPEGSRIEAAVPFSPGGHAIFVFARVQRVETLPGGLFRHGTSYDRKQITT